MQEERSRKTEQQVPRLGHSASLVVSKTSKGPCGYSRENQGQIGRRQAGGEGSDRRPVDCIYSLSLGHELLQT